MYATVITADLKTIGHAEIEPRLVEGYMRAEHGTLNHLCRAEFVQAARETADIYHHAQGGKEHLDRLAKSFGL